MTKKKFPFKPKFLKKPIKKRFYKKKTNHYDIDSILSENEININELGSSTVDLGKISDDMNMSIFYRSELMKNIPLIPIRDMVIFPNSIVPIFIGRAKSIKAVEIAMKNNKKIFIVSQKNPGMDDIKFEDLEKVGVLANIIQSIRLPDGTIKLLVDATNRASLKNYSNFQHHIEAEIEIHYIDNLNQTNINQLIGMMRGILDQATEYSSFSSKITYDVIRTLSTIKNPDIFSDILMSYLNIDHDKKQTILELINIKDRLEEILKMLISENEIIKTEREIQEKIKRQIDKNQKEYYLNEQLKVIRTELGEGDGISEAVEKYERFLKNRKLPEHALEKIKEEIKRLKHTSGNSSEAGVIKTYLDLIFDLPWLQEKSILNNSIIKAEEILERDHYGMEKAKERILESLAVQMRNHGSIQKNIICLYGAPGVGKTSLARSIAEATGRKYVKISLGGMKDEAEIRGHRKTYIGSMPGKIIAAMKKAKVTNPLILLDEVDKLGMDNRGDPASALLEVLDYEQNKEFSDHYLEIEYDLSNVMFIITANTLNMPRPLLDRLEIIKIPSYLEQEKFKIAQNYIIPKKMQDIGIKPEELKISDGTIKDIIRYYTREAGVRELNRKIEEICRKSVKKIMKENLEKISITSKNLNKFLGIKKYLDTEIEKSKLIGVVNGLAYTEVGGDILLIESVKIPNGKGEIKYTGSLGDVMKESTQTAYSFVRSNADLFGINIDDMKNCDVHLHVPEGATPKDGPSAGITIATALVSLFTGKPVSNKLAMTGEITLRGRILPIGGLREKLVSALRSGIKIVVIPKQNEKDLTEIPSYVTQDLEIKFFNDAFEAIKFNLSRL